MPSSPSERKPKLNLEFEALGTHWSITSSCPESADVETAIRARIDVFDKTYSRFISTSSLMKMTATKGIYSLDDDAKALFDFYEQLYKVTDGLVTPLIGRTMEQAGYDASYSLKPGRLEQPPAWDEALKHDFPKLQVLQPIVLDFGAAGKGYLVDIIGELMQGHGVSDYCINAGGDILVSGSAQLIGLENPGDVSEAIGTVTVMDGAICSSAGNRRKWAGFHHTINPKTLRSPENIAAIWVRANTAMLADGLATALYFTDPDILRRHFAFEYAMIKGNDIIASDNFGAEFFSA